MHYANKAVAASGSTNKKLKNVTTCFVINPMPSKTQKLKFDSGSGYKTKSLLTLMLQALVLFKIMEVAA